MSLYWKKIKMTRVAIVEDDRDLAELISYNLEREGFQTIIFNSATDFFNFLREETPDLVLLDVMLPDSDGFRIADFLKKRPDLMRIPVIFITARGTEEDKLRGFDLGADDYITKPFSLKELVARVRAVLGRQKRREMAYELDGIRLLPGERKLFVEGREVYLTPAEFEILLLLFENYGKPLSREFIVDALWRLGRETSERSVDVHIKHIRDKLGKYKNYIKTVRGVGYKLEKK